MTIATLPRIASLGDACCGCGACAAVCACGCVTVAADALGFPHPVVDASACAGCGACERACPAVSPREEVDVAQEALWARALDAELLDRSSSGGVFGLLAREVLSTRGVVAGAAFSDGCREVRHVVVDCLGDLDTVMRSKYVQSSVDSEVYGRVRAELRAGRRVLFAGTACQVAGMRGFLGKLTDNPNLLLVDVICHGVPSPELWRRWLDWRSRSERMEINEVNFRSKITGWLSYSVMYKHITEKDNASRFSANKFADDWYMKAFLANASLRASCFRCPAKRRCGSDITLGDFWGIQNAHPEVNCEGGVSAVICNTERGAAALGEVLPHTEHGSSTYGEVLAGNSALAGSVEPYAKRDEFLQAIADGEPLDGIIREWTFAPTFARRVRNKLSVIKRHVKMALRR
ncbi:MAG: Coenzyme F420 hydrogenase/dehydrogenase, beta subunit C-terminal domain [Eggerthellaceae bacterium]|nr:Coenzyme F420 hydrogenase/dehydrogenase, beta subunit C-terminal domain [Eggerthellaceae bacterium]